MKFLILVLLTINICFAQVKPKVVFIIKEKDIIPEGIAYDPAQEIFYLSSIHKHKILKINSKGNVSDFITSDQDGVIEVLGMKVDRSGNLWACNNSPEQDSINKIANIHIYNTKTKKLIRKFSLADGKKHLFNDLVFLNSGDVYITDTNESAIYMIKKNSERLEEFFAPGSIQFPNGITATSDEKKLIVATGGPLGIVTLDLATKKIESIKHPKFTIVGADGLYRDKNKLIAVQNNLFPEGIFELTLNNDNRSFEKINFLTSNEKQFDTPTTGVIVDNEFYFIANSQLMQVLGNNGKIKNPEELNETLIMKITLN
jgi:sugar lactone lactonase YvrE